MISYIQHCEVPKKDYLVADTLIRIESSGRPLAVAVVGEPSFFQPKTKHQAIRMTNALKHLGYRYSAGLMQISSGNFESYSLNNENVFEPCTNIHAGLSIFRRCYSRSQRAFPNIAELQNLKNAASCYYSGNFTTGFKLPRQNGSYVERFMSFYKNH